MRASFTQAAIECANAQTLIEEHAAASGQARAERDALRDGEVSERNLRRARRCRQRRQAGKVAGRQVAEAAVGQFARLPAQRARSAALQVLCRNVFASGYAARNPSHVCRHRSSGTDDRDYRSEQDRWNEERGEQVK